MANILHAQIYDVVCESGAIEENLEKFGEKKEQHFSSTSNWDVVLHLSISLPLSFAPVQCFSLSLSL